MSDEGLSCNGHLGKISPTRRNPTTIIAIITYLVCCINLLSNINQAYVPCKNTLHSYPKQATDYTPVQAESVSVTVTPLPAWGFNYYPAGSWGQCWASVLSLCLQPHSPRPTHTAYRNVRSLNVSPIGMWDIPICLHLINHYLEIFRHWFHFTHHLELVALCLFAEISRTIQQTHLRVSWD